MSVHEIKHRRKVHRVLCRFRHRVREWLDEISGSKGDCGSLMLHAGDRELREECFNWMKDRGV
jgi:hypothetical protein